ncbi:hypothetical protein LguiB_033543 [Lonicera macranthoides]
MEMDHFSHEHPLKFIDEARRNEGDVEILCDVCRESVILGSAAYICNDNECKYILHKKCAELPMEINHPMHLEHSLTFTSTISELRMLLQHLPDSILEVVHLPLFRLPVRRTRIMCSSRGRDYTRIEGHHHRLSFVPRSSEEYLDSDLMNFPLPDRSIDLISRFVKSTSLEAVNDLARELIHLSHNHPLILIDVQSDNTEMINKVQCDGGYRLRVTGSKYGCGTCGEFDLGSCCVNLPSTFKHEWDRHQLTLSYPPFSYHPDEFICEICEEDIHLNYWLYHCRQCDQSFHTECIKPFDWYSKVKFGGTLEVENHPHSLVFVQKSKKNKKSPNSICNQCGESRDGWLFLECTPCNFQLCLCCCRDIVQSLLSP